MRIRKRVIVGLAVLLIAVGWMVNDRLSAYLSQESTLVLDEFALNNQPDSFGYRVLSGDDPNLFIFRTDIAGASLEQIDTPGYMLVIYRLAGQWYRVRFNGVLIGAVGNQENDRSNIWNDLNSFVIDPELVREHNQLEVEVFATYELGSSTFPPIITDSVTASKLHNLVYFLRSSINTMIIGTVLAIAILVLALNLLSAQFPFAYLCYGLALVCMALTLTDYLVLYSLPISLVAFKKLVIVAMYLSVFAISWGISSQFKSRLAWYVGLATTAVVLIGALVIRETHSFFAFFTRLNIAMAVNPLSWLYITYRNLDKLEARILFGAALALLIFGLIDLAFMLSGISPLITVLPYAALAFSLAVLALTILHYLAIHSRIAYHTQKAELLYEQAVTDHMTGLYNHQFIVNTLSEMAGDYTLVMMDIDEFKAVNDTYGHQAGDIAVKIVARQAKTLVRSSDIVGRYGGDEFILILPNCREEQGIAIARKIKNSVEQQTISHKDNQFRLTLSIGVYAPAVNEGGDSALYKVDTALYLAKSRGKRQICSYSELEQTRRGELPLELG